MTGVYAGDMGVDASLARRCQSESTGVILIVLVVFVLGTSVAAFAFTTFQEERGVAPSVVMEYGYDEVGNGDLRVGVRSESGGPGDGSGFEGANVVFVCEAGDCAGADGRSWDGMTGGGSGPDGRVVAGDSVTLEAGDDEVGRDAVLLVRWEEPTDGGKTALLARWRGPDA